MFLKKIWVVIVFIFSCSIVNAQSNIDILHYKFNISLNDKNDTVYGEATIKLSFLQADNSFSLDLNMQNKQGKGMKIDKIHSVGAEIKNFTIENEKVTIPLSKAASKNDTMIFTIQYHGIPGDGLIISKNRHGQRTFFADNWPDRAHYWIPCKDNPADKSSFEFIVIAPSHYEVISNGVQVEEKKLSGNKKLTHWKEDIPLSTKIMAIGVADFAIKKYTDSPPGIPVTAWIFEKDSTDGFKDYDQAPTILKFFINYIGPYPYKKLANVQSKTVFGGMENASAIFYAENSITGNHDQESLLAHEIPHQWFGDMVTEKSFAHFWLSEGFATYLTHFYIGSKYGTDSLNSEMKDDRERVVAYSRQSRKPIVDSVSPYSELLNINSYEKAGWVLHMLRRQLGDTIFQNIVRSFYDTYKGKNADTKDLQAIAEKVSGKNLDQFFRQWLYTAGIPYLLTNWKYNSKEKKLVVTVEQLQTNEAFIFPLDILIVSEPGKTQTETLNISNKKETFTFPVNKQPMEIIADPHTSLLFQGSVRELK